MELFLTQCILAAVLIYFAKYDIDYYYKNKML